MQTTVALLGLAAVAFAAPQTPAAANKAPQGAAPAGCSPDFSGTFEIQAETVVSKRDACGGPGTLVTTLKGGILTDSTGRQGNIVSNNNQFQYDPAPGQANFIYNSGFSACSNGSLALGGTTQFYQCQSGGFYNIYFFEGAPTAQQCSPIQLGIIPCGSSGGSPVSQQADGQPTGSAVPVGQKTDGQPTAGTAVPVSQISDGQPQVKSAVPVQQITDGQVQIMSAVPISQISDGQIQATGTAKPISQISDGQIQATGTAKPISQISDGQIQATGTAKPISQISDGQIQATAKATVTTAKPLSQISDGQIQATAAPKVNATTTQPLQVTGGSNSLQAFGSQLAAIVLGAVAVALL